MGDGETGKLHHSRGVPISRDVLHFVPFRAYNGNTSACVADALCDVPEQFVQYFLNSGLKPMPPLPVPDFTSSSIVGDTLSKKRQRKLAREQTLRMSMSKMRQSETFEQSSMSKMRRSLTLEQKRINGRLKEVSQ